jgi:ribosomal protein S18 acetylase RimI-like enzyme
VVDDPGIVVAAHAVRPIGADQVLALYGIQGWWPDRTAEQVRDVLDSGPAVGAWRDDRLVGFVRAVSDGALRAYLEDVLVAPEFRDAGLGRALIAAILGLLQPIPVISLFCEPGLAAFYEAAGFRLTRQVILHRS